MYGFNGTIYSQLPLTISTVSGSGSKSASLSWTLPSGITTVKILRQINGGGYTNSKNVIGSSTTDDTTDTSWASTNVVVTPTSFIGSAARFDKNITTLTNDAQVQIVSTGTGTRYPKLLLGIAADSASTVTRILELYRC